MTTKNTRINVVFDPGDYEEISEMAVARGVSKSEMVRRLTTGGVLQLPSERFTDEQYEVVKESLEKIFEALSEHFRDSAGIGNNLNQIARKVNSGERADLALIESLVRAHVGSTSRLSEKVSILSGQLGSVL